MTIQSNTQAQPEQNETPAPFNAFNTPLKHRINACIGGEFLNLFDTINPSLERASALADLIEVACEVADIGSFEPDTLWRSAQAIRFEIKDVQTLLKAYIDAKKASERAVQP